MQSVFEGRDPQCLDAMFAFYAPDAERIVDVCCNRRKMWKGLSISVVGYDIDPDVQPDVVCSWDDLPDDDCSVDVVCFDPPHLPKAATSSAKLSGYDGFGLTRTCDGENNVSMFSGMLNEAKRVLRADGMIFAKIKDYVHNHKYQWNLEAWNREVRAAGLTPCDLIIKRDPCGGNLKSGRWKRRHHARNVHCYWSVVRNGRCEPRRTA